MADPCDGRNTASTQPRGESRTILLDSGLGGCRGAARLLRAGGLVAFPTETVYGLGADASDAGAVAALYAAKGRPAFNPLIAHLPDRAKAQDEGLFSRAAERLAEAFWPGPLTLVVPLAPGSPVCDLARAGLATLGLRVPDHPVARAVLQETGRPVVAPSANRSGHVSPTLAAHVLADLSGRIDAVVDGGATEVGVESTIVACLGGGTALLRPGGVDRAAIEEVLGHPIASGRDGGETPIAPGALVSHYAPRARVRLDAEEIRAGEAALLFGPDPPRGLDRAATSLNLSERGDLAEAASRLFGHLRKLDTSGADSIAVAPVPEKGLGEAINDRLRRAAAERA